MSSFSQDRVVLIRWPMHEARRKECERLGIARLLVIEGGIEAPVCADPLQDWVRAPAGRGDITARVLALRQRAHQERFPQVDPSGSVRFAGRSVTVSPIAAELLVRLARSFGQVVSREALRSLLPTPTGAAGRNALDLHMMRIRRRIASVGLRVDTFRGRGYALVSNDNDSEPAMSAG